MNAPVASGAFSAVALRPYQAEAVTAALASHRAGENPVVSSPTGSGKSVIVGRLAGDLRASGAGRIVITVSSRELAEQNERAVRRFLPAADVGVVCAALGRREGGRAVTIGTPQSLAGAIDYDPACVIVDEAHQMPLHRGSWFHRLFEALPRGKTTPRIGLSATTFRTADGAIYGSVDSWFTCQPFEVSVQELVDDGYLAPVRYVAPGAAMTTRGVSRAAGDFNGRELAQANAALVDEQARITLEALRDRRKAMVFAVTVDHATAFRDAFQRLGEPAALIVGAMAADDRVAQVKAFKAGTLRVAVTVSAALTGFDVPDIDLLACCRPTMSPIIHTQSIGRGTRPFAGKADLLALDFAGNVTMFGPVHRPHFDRTGQPLGGVAPWRACKACGTFNHFEDVTCFHCDAELPVRRAVTTRDLEFGSINWTPEKNAMWRLVNAHGWQGHPVESLALHAYRKKSDPESISCMVSFGLGGDAIVRTWFKKLGKSRRWQAFWAMLLGDAPAPRSLPEAQSRRSELIRPASIDLEHEDGFWRVVAVDYDEDEVEESAALNGAEAILPILEERLRT